MHSDFSYAQLQGKILPQFLKILWKRHTCVVWTMNTLLSVPTHRCGLSRVNKGRPVPGQANCTMYLLYRVLSKLINLTVVLVSFIQRSYRPSLNGLAVSAGEECRGVAEVTLSLQKVLSDAAATSEPQLESLFILHQ